MIRIWVFKRMGRNRIDSGSLCHLKADKPNGREGLQTFYQWISSAIYESWIGSINCGFISLASLSIIFPERRHLNESSAENIFLRTASNRS
jgi:hypothetical protein